MYRRYLREDVRFTYTLFPYGIEVDAFIHTTDFKKYGWVLDGKGWGCREDGLAHMINSCHPDLPPPYNIPNVQLHLEQPDDLFDPQTRPPLVIAETIVPITGYCELIADYHWLLIGIYTPLYMRGEKPLGSCGCEHCFATVDDMLIQFFC